LAVLLPFLLVAVISRFGLLVLIHLLPELFEESYLHLDDRVDGYLVPGRLQRTTIPNGAGPDDARLAPIPLEANDAGVADEGGENGQTRQSDERGVTADGFGALLGEGAQRLGQSVQGKRLIGGDLSAGGGRLPLGQAEPAADLRHDLLAIAAQVLGHGRPAGDILAGPQLRGGVLDGPKLGLDIARLGGLVDGPEQAFGLLGGPPGPE